MANRRFRDAAGSTKYAQAEGAGTDADPFVDATGAAFILAASAAIPPVVDALGTAVTINGKWRDLIIVCHYTLKGTDAGDTCDVFIDVLVGSTWLNAICFTRALGNGTDVQIEFAKLGSNVTGAATVTATADCASGVVRPSMIGSQIRARWTVVNTSTADASFTFSVYGYAL